MDFANLRSAECPWLDVAPVGDAIVVRFTQSHLLNAEPVRSIGHELFNIVDQNAGHPIVLNFAKVSHLSSSMLAKLYRLHQKLETTSGKLALCGLQPDVHDAFRATELNKLFSIYRDESDAIEHLKTKES
jgi:anti-anti-sigma factor